MLLKELLKRGPGQTVAFMPEPEADLLAETMVAFANGDGGTIFIGLDAQGRVLDYMAGEAAESSLVKALLMCWKPTGRESFWLSRSDSAPPHGW